MITPPSAPGSTTTRWWLLAVAVLALRWPLGSLPAPGRDEALYVYWSDHPEPAYAPLLQLLLRAASASGLDAAMVWRLPTLVAGALALLLFDRLLRDRGLGRHGRFVAVAAVALSPWQTHVGSVVHPDPLMLVGLLGIALAARREMPWMLALGAAVAFWAKPSGLLAVAVALVALGHRATRGPRRASTLGAALVLAAVTAFPLAHWNESMVEAVRQFGRLADSMPWSLRAARAGVGLLFLGGPLLLLATGLGSYRALRRGPEDPGGWIGLSFLLAFGGAAVALGQIKANWMLPAALLLWPGELASHRRTVGFGLLAGLVLSASVSLAFSRPELVRSLEERGVPGLFSYRGFAGEREEAVAPAARWWHRLAVYRGLGALPETVLSHVPEGSELTRIVSDDYGLAAQLRLALQQRRPSWDPRLVLPLDPLFAGSDPAGTRRSGTTLVLAVQSGLDRLGQDVDRRFELSHPVTGRAFPAGLVRPSPPTSTAKGTP